MGSMAERLEGLMRDARQDKEGLVRLRRDICIILKEHRGAAGLSGEQLTGREAEETPED